VKILDPIISGEREQNFAENSENAKLEDRGYDGDDDIGDDGNEWHHEDNHNDGEKSNLMSSSIFPLFALKFD
jgi:hypothetical protein